MTLSVSEPVSADAVEPRLEVPPHLSRSWLLVAAPALPARDLAGTADQIIVDIEDAIPDPDKDSARGELGAWFAAGNSAWVRINDRSTVHWGSDIAALRALDGVLGVVLAKTETVGDVEDTWNALGRVAPVIPLVESAVGIENVAEIAAGPGVLRLAFGSGDYRRDIGAAPVDAALAYPRSRLVVASRVAGLPGPIDGPSLSTEAHTVSAYATDAASLGMTGQLCLHVSQVHAVEKSMSPSSAEVQWARQLLHAPPAAIDGSYRPQLKRAERIVELATTYGLVSS